jgi:hypothetical protein
MSEEWQAVVLWALIAAALCYAHWYLVRKGTR